MPLADARRAIAVLLGEPGNRQPIGRDEWRLPDADDTLLQTAAPVIPAGQQRVARRRTDSGRRMRVGETQPLRRETIDARREDLAALGVVARDVTVTEVVGQDDDDVGRP